MIVPQDVFSSLISHTAPYLLNNAKSRSLCHKCSRCGIVGNLSTHSKWLCGIVPTEVVTLIHRTLLDQRLMVPSNGNTGVVSAESLSTDSERSTSKRWARRLLAPFLYGKKVDDGYQNLVTRSQLNRNFELK